MLFALAALHNGIPVFTSSHGSAIASLHQAIGRAQQPVIDSSACHVLEQPYITREFRSSNCKITHSLL